MDNFINKVIFLIIIIMIIVEAIKHKKEGKFTINKGRGINVLERIRYSLFKGQLELIGVFEATVVGKETTVNRRNIATNHYLIITDPSKRLVGKVNVIKKDYFKYEADSIYGRKAFFTNRNNPDILIISREEDVDIGKHQIVIESRIYLLILSIVITLLAFSALAIVYHTIQLVG